MMRFATTFRADTRHNRLDLGTVIRLIPDRYERDSRPPIPEPGQVITLVQVVPVGDFEVVASAAEEITLKKGPRTWVLTPLRPTEGHMTVAYTEGLGISEWMVR